MLFSVAGIVSMGMHWHTIGSPVPLGVDFRGGTQVQVQFQTTPDLGQIRTPPAPPASKTPASCL